MATTTPNLGLKKPNVTDKVNVSDLNGNADLLDATIGKLSDLNTAQRNSLVSAINEALTSAGTAAGFGNPVATVDGNTGTPSVEVTASGPDTAKVFTFTFKNLKGAKGDPGAAGEDGTSWWTYNGVFASSGEKIWLSYNEMPNASIGDFVLHTRNDAGVVYEITGLDPLNYGEWLIKKRCVLKGAAGSSIQSIERTSGTGAPGTTDTYTVTLTNGNTTTFQVYNGKDGSGSGDMEKAVYDPKGKAQDIFSYADTKYSKPSGGIPKKDLASAVQTSLGKADSALQSVPSTYRTASAQDTIDSGKQAKITASGLLKGNGAGGVSAAVKGTDYAAPSVGVSVTLTAYGWNANAKTQTVSVAVVTATANCIITAAPDSYMAYAKAGVRCTAQGAGTLTFACETVPTANVVANVLIIG